MVNAIELRVGNKVLYWVMGEEEVMAVDGIDIALIEQGMVQVKPIQITEEWMERFGFEEHSRDIGRVIYRHKEELLMLEYQNGICWLVFVNEVLSTEIEYVHQLQNLTFALTGEELKIIKLEP